MDYTCEMARRQSLVTHQGDEASEFCILLIHIIYKIFNEENLKAILVIIIVQKEQNCKGVSSSLGHPAIHVS